MKMRASTSTSVSTPPVRRRSSARVSLGLVAFVAGTLAACGTAGPGRRCIDQDSRVVPDPACDSDRRVSSYPGVYHWYYGGSGYRIGQQAFGGSTTPGSGTAAHSTTTRGGFGDSAAAHGSGGS